MRGCSPRRGRPSEYRPVLGGQVPGWQARRIPGQEAACLTCQQASRPAAAGGPRATTPRPGQAGLAHAARAGDQDHPGPVAGGGAEDRRALILPADKGLPLRRADAPPGRSFPGFGQEWLAAQYALAEFTGIRRRVQACLAGEPVPERVERGQRPCLVAARGEGLHDKHRRGLTERFPGQGPLGPDDSFRRAAGDQRRRRRTFQGFQKGQRQVAPVLLRPLRVGPMRRGTAPEPRRAGR